MHGFIIMQSNEEFLTIEKNLFTFKKFIYLPFA